MTVTGGDDGEEEIAGPERARVDRDASQPAGRRTSDLTAADGGHEVGRRVGAVRELHG